MKKLFGQINLTWKKLIIFAVIAGVYTGIMAAIPIAKDTSFADISITFEWWILFGIIIIMNSRSPLDSALKCFVFFLISQPVVYLIQVPFNVYGWGIFAYYPGWFRWTLLTFPMGFVGYFMKKEKWWSLVILAAMLVFVGFHYYRFLIEAKSYFPHHLLSAVFCVATVILYPLCIFNKKQLKTAGLVLGIAILAVGTFMGLRSERNRYSTTLLVNGGELKAEFDDTYKAWLEDESFGTVSIVFEEHIEDYMVNADLYKTGETKLILESPDGEKQVFALTVGRNTYEIEYATDPGE